MKFRKTLGVLLTLLGCIAAFLGLAAAVVPLVSNAQLQLVLDSFATPSRSLLVNAINQLMTFVLSHSLPVLLGGLLAASAGIAVLACNAAAVPGALGQICACAFAPRAALGGAGGQVKTVLKAGYKLEEGGA